MAKHWWAQRWLQPLETGGLSSRLSRGRKLARTGEALPLSIQSGSMYTNIEERHQQCNRITISLQPFSDTMWDQITHHLSLQALSLAQLLAGDMPLTIDEIVACSNLSFFPSTLQDINFSCSCSDWATPCIHGVALAYRFAQQFDEDPLLLFHLRGRTRTRLFESIRQKRTLKHPEVDFPLQQEPEEMGQFPPQSLCSYTPSSDNFWDIGHDIETAAIHMPPPLGSTKRTRLPGEALQILWNDWQNDPFDKLSQLIQAVCSIKATRR